MLCFMQHWYSSDTSKARTEKICCDSEFKGDGKSVPISVLTHFSPILTWLHSLCEQQNASCVGVAYKLTLY